VIVVIVVIVAMTEMMNVEKDSRGSLTILETARTPIEKEV